MRTEWPLAGFIDRWGGDLLDGMVMSAVVSVVFFASYFRPLGAAMSTVETEYFGAGDVVALLWFLWNLTYLVGKTGQSWGRKLAGVKVIDADGEPIGFWKALGRNLFAIFVSAPAFYLGFLWVIWDRDKQAWHDKVFKTYVVRKVVK